MSKAKKRYERLGGNCDKCGADMKGQGTRCSRGVLCRECFVGPYHVHIETYRSFGPWMRDASIYCD